MGIRPAMVGLLAAASFVSVSTLLIAQGRTPRTPWGDPDLQGTYTNKAEQGAPFERPAEFAGRKLEDFTPEETRQLAQRRQEQTLERAPFFGGGDVPGIGNSAEFRDIYDIHKGSRPWFVTDPPDGRIPAMTDEGKARIAKQQEGRGGRGAGPNSHLDFGLFERCITRGYPGSMLPTGYGNSFDIVQGPGVVAIRYEMIHETRVIPIGREPGMQAQRPHVSAAIQMDMGDARGWWEGETLVVETRNLKQRSAYRNANVERLRVIERFKRTAPDKVEWTVTIDDPSTWVRPWTFSLPLSRDDTETVIEYGCHEGNSAVVNILSAVRAAERAQTK